MGLWDDLEEVASDGVDAVGNLVDGAEEAAEEGLEEVGNFVLEEILGIDVEGSDEGSPSEGHDYDGGFDSTSDELRLAGPTAQLLTTVREASTESNVSRLFWANDIYGTIDDAITEPDAMHLFDDVAGAISDIVSETEARPLHGVPVHVPEWTNFNQGDPGPALLQVPSFLTADSLFVQAQGDDTTHTLPADLAANAPAADVDLPDLNGNDSAIVADNIEAAGALIFADTLESMRLDGTDTDLHGLSLELPPFLVDSVSDDSNDRTIEAYTVQLPDTGQLDFAIAFEDASSSQSVSWLF